MVAMVQRGQACDSLVRYQEMVIQLGLRAEASSDSVLVLTQKELNEVKALVKILEDKFQVQLALTVVAIKQKRKWVVIAIGSIGLLILETTLVILGSAH